VDGPGSALDADSVDGVHASGFLLATGGAVSGPLNVSDTLTVGSSLAVTGGVTVGGALAANGDLLAYGKSVTSVTDVRAVVSKTAANGVCPAGTAIYTPWAYRGATGSQICAADSRGQTSCKAVIYVYVTIANGFGVYAPNDPSCDTAVDNAWPWGRAPGTPNTLDSEWGYGDTYVVCCGPP
jgi:hypothetical protein